jgi:hypothetical protein
MTDQLRVSKIDAARRQLDGAIQLWFAEGDPVAVHSLACAAHQIVQDINEQRGNRNAHLAENMKAVIKPEHLDEAVALLRKPVNFFKHANRDPYGILEFAPITTLLFVMLAIVGIEELGERKSDSQSAFLSWLMIHKPTWFKTDVQIGNQTITAEQRQLLQALPKKEFLETSLRKMARARLNA